jgi:hypothetical protein
MKAKLSQPKTGRPRKQKIMAIEQDLKQLHDQATRGLALTAEEQARLEAWYAQLDQEETSALAGTPRLETLTSLHAQVESVTVRLLPLTQRIQATAAENDRLRREIVTLQQAD